MRDVPRNHLAAIDVPSAGLVVWDPDVNGDVRAVGASAGVVAAGGSFSAARDLPRAHVAAIDPEMGGATLWRPEAEGVTAVVTPESNAREADAAQPARHGRRGS